MNKLWILLFTVLAVSCITAHSYQYDEYDDVINYPEDPEEYDDTNIEINKDDNLDDVDRIFDDQPLPEPNQIDPLNRDEILQDDHVIENQELPLPEENDQVANDYADKEVLDEIDEYRKNIEDDVVEDPREDIASDYQFEDNRSKQYNEDKESNDGFEEDIPAENAEDAVVDDDDQIFEETRAILSEDNDNEDFEDDAQIQDTVVDDTNNENEEDIPFNDNAQANDLNENDQTILEETKAILNEDDNENMDQFHDDVNGNENENVDELKDEEIKPEYSFQELDEILDNIDDNLKQLNEMGKQQEFDEEGILNNSNENEDDGMVQESDDTQSILDGNVYDDVVADYKQDEDTMPVDNEQQVDDVGNFFSFLDTNDDTANEDKVYDDAPLEFEEQNESEEQQQNDEINDFKQNDDWKKNNDQDNPISSEDDVISDNNPIDDYDTSKILDDLDDDLKSLFKTWNKLSQPDSEESNEEQSEEQVEDYEPKQIGAKTFDDELEADIPQEETLHENVSGEDETQEANQVDEQNQEIDGENPEKYEDLNLSSENDAQENIEKPTFSEDEIAEEKSINVNDLTKDMAQYDDLMKQFAIRYKDEFDVQAKGLAREVAPIHMKISVDEATVVTSPNYPEPYPTNNIVDWIFEGEGTGIEFNITDLALSGGLGDYLLVKPGAEDETGTDGLLFSYTLAEPRNYRFFDVDKMFVRFEAKLGLAFNRGFQFSVKMINPLPEETEPMPDPAPLLPTPSSVMTVNLGGVTAEEFLSVKEDFRQLIADMATMYINANFIEAGVNTTSEVTQITNTAICKVNWPGFESCVQVSFAVPLVYTDDRPARLDSEDLQTMWTTYINADPFAQRLKRLGIEEFAVPNDSRILMVWFVIGAGVLISAVLLALALWRFSCFEDYTRMPAFSDSDSIMNEKRGLDLYPTPHQNLPPLYGDSDSKDFKWEESFGDSTRVDMGGYANKSFTRDELYDIESDEDNIMSTRDRTSITPRDIYKV